MERENKTLPIYYVILMIRIILIAGFIGFTGFVISPVLWFLGTERPFPKLVGLLDSLAFNKELEES